MSVDYVPLSTLLAIPPEYGANASAEAPNGTDPRYLRITDISDSGMLLFDDIKSIPRKIAQFSLLQQDDIVIARTGNTVGKSYIHKPKNGELAFAGYLIRFRIDQSKADPQFVFQFLHSPDYYSWKDKTLRTGAQPNINAQEYLRLQLPKFKLSEQRKIAKILSTLEDLIDQTHSLIAKYNAIKQGMMQDLFARGVGKNGELRPQYVEASRSYKESKLGWIPKDWNVTTLGDGCHRITDGAHASVVTSQDGDVPFLYVSCVRENLIDWEKASFISRKTFSQISKGREPEPGMILYTVVGSYGYAALIEEQKDFSFQRHIGCIYPDEDKFVPSFLVQLLNADRSKAFADSVAVGNAQKTITLGTLKKFPVICPPKDEQNVISELIESIQSSTAFERNTLEKLLLLKSGLMQDLLTGKVRVNVDESTESERDVGVHQS